jgi:glycosyltransferase involved in cell wall biosynthesis
VRILVIGLNYTPEPTGIAPYTASFARGMVERGHQVRVVTAMPHYPEWRVREGYERRRLRETMDGVLVDRVSHFVPRHPDGVRRLLSEISFGLHAVIVRWGRPDVVVFVSPALFATAIGVVRARLQGLRVAVWVQDLYNLGLIETHGRAKDGLVARAVGAVESTVLRSVAGVCVIHERFAAAVTLLNTRPARVKVVRNWTHLSAPSTWNRSDVRRHLGWGVGEMIALHSGAMGRKQDLYNLIDAGRLATRSGVPVRFILMGNGGERERLELAAEGVPSVTFMDPLPGELYQHALAAADVLIVNEHVGLREMAVPSKLTSYFSSGRPVVAATDGASLAAEEVAAAGAGVRVPPGDPEALLDAVMRLDADPDRAAEMGRRGQHYRDSVLSEAVALNAFEAWLHGITRSGEHDRTPVSDDSPPQRRSRTASSQRSVM